MAKRKKEGYSVQVRMVGEDKVWGYHLEALSAGNAVERILWHMGWLPAAYADTFVVCVKRADAFPVY